MSLLLATLLLMFFMLIGWLMILLFPRVFPPFVQLQQDTAGTTGLGGYGEFHLWILVFAVPLLFIGLGIVVAFIVTMREEAHRETF